jgi:uncharacterized membrane protein YoaK (UPF0700 family)
LERPTRPATGCGKVDSFQMYGTPSPSEAPFAVIATLFGLTFVTGLIDAASFLGLGHVFTANMTGNVVFVGFALGGAADLSILRSLAALGAFASGSVVGGIVTSRRSRTPARHLLIAMYAETLVLSVAAVAALVTGNGVTSVSVYLVIVCTAVAMGLRNAVVRKLAVPDLTTTVLTLTVTGLAADSRLAGGAGSRSDGSEYRSRSSARHWWSPDLRRICSRANARRREMALSHIGE